MDPGANNGPLVGRNGGGDGGDGGGLPNQLVQM
jgi:hypothetical protein